MRKALFLAIIAAVVAAVGASTIVAATSAKTVVVSTRKLPKLGTVLVNGKPLLVGEQIPFGATIDTTHGTVIIQTTYRGVVQTWQFATGIFILTQLPTGETLLTLTGGDFTICKTTTKGTRHVAAATVKSSNTHAVRGLWGNGTGHFQVKGRYGAASVRGTVFHVVDRCDGTLVHVRHGLVAVINLKTGKTTLVPAGKSLLVTP